MTPYGIIRPLAPQKLQSVKCIFSGVQWKRLNCSFQIHILFHNIDSNFDNISSIVQFMMTSSNGNISCVTVPLCREFTGPRWIPAQRPGTRSFDVFFDLLLNKWLSKQPWGWWFEAPSWSLWRQCNVVHVSHARKTHGIDDACTRQWTGSTIQDHLYDAYEGILRNVSDIWTKITKISSMECKLCQMFCKIPLCQMQA